MFRVKTGVSILSVLCTSFIVPGYAASSVRSLGGAGTYIGTNSAVKTNTTSTRTKSASSNTTGARAGALRINPTSTRVTAGSASLRTPSTRSAATTQRLSLGKYLSGSSAISGGSSVKVDPEKSGLVSSDEFNDVKDGFEEVRVDVESLKNDLQELTGKEHITVYQEGNTVYIETDSGEVIEIPVIDDAAAADQLNTWLENNQIIKNLEQKILESGNEYQGSDDGFVSVTDNKISIAGAIASSLRNPTVADSEKLVTVKQVTEYAIPKPNGCSGGTICVLSYNDDLDVLEWLELVDDTDVPLTGGMNQTTVNTTTGDELSNDDYQSMDSASNLNVSDQEIVEYDNF